MAFDDHHAPGVVETLSEEYIMSSIDTNTIPPEAEESIEHANAIVQKISKPDLYSLISLHDFEDVARQTLTAKAYAFYSSAATDLVSHHANLDVNKKLLLRPRVLRIVKEAKTRRRILGNDSSSPFFFSPAAMAKLAHPDGELGVARACSKKGIIQIVSMI